MNDREQLIANMKAALDRLAGTAAADAAPDDDAWTAAQTAALAGALKSVPKDSADRWDQIAAAVGSRTREECLVEAKRLIEAAKAKALQPPAEWTELETSILIKAASTVFPAGTPDRWQQIAEHLRIHAKTTWTRTEKDIIAKTHAKKDVSRSMAEKKAADARSAKEHL